MICDDCDKDSGICLKSCKDLKCDEDILIIRDRYRLPETQIVQTISKYTPRIHFGRFGSANIVMKSGMDRDRIVKADGVSAFEMESAGVWDRHPTVVIKGASDYADSYKNDDW